MPLALFALTVASFGIGTSEFVIMGLLPDVARDLGVSIPSAGLLVSGYALGVFIGAPILAVITARMPRKLALLVAMGIFTVGNFLCAVAPNYWLLMLARMLTAFCHAAFFGIGAVVAADLVPQNKRAQAISMMFAGLTVANILGVPFGTGLGQIAGWRVSFWAVVLIGLISETALAVLLPANLKMEVPNLAREFRILARPMVLLNFLISMLVSVSLFTVFTYITPILEDVTGFTPRAVTGILLLFGVGMTIGNLLGGRLADWKGAQSLMACLLVLALVLLAFTWTSHSGVPAMVTVTAWGILTFSVVPPLQLRIVDKAVGASNLASTMNQGVFNLGNATGAWLGGFAINAGIGYGSLPLIGAAVAGVALILTLLSESLERRRVPAGGIRVGNS
ncbi:MFS transporter, DHA1 family, inner membrane transport protein [Faunimonas pinastri]|uniref:MFS transporter, DHA1 family, inner membrane transport protein n=1 Tax=Faunimonas pinastri TaxID=1855383 RepID=A0A1H9A264_9HYPH|nr:MFS transporter [Faunimonas pinastri]SEP70749.1 MFS transporter, DHA1 family, inner membrane transport protein [Faunimonas pinastri]